MLDATKEVTTQGGEDTYHPLLPVQCIAFLDKKGRRKNVRYSLSKQLGLKRIGFLLLTQNTRTEKLCIIGGGPSINNTYKDISGDIMTIGSAHDHAIGLGIKPHWHVECDPTVEQTKFYTKKQKGCKYLVASRVDKSMWAHLSDMETYVWNMWEQDLGKPVYRGEPAFICGATVMLAAVPIAMALGYREFHFFGIDSSFDTFEQHHAYGEVPETSQVIKVRVGDAQKGKEYMTTATWVGQAQQYQEMVQHWGHMFRANFHGGGMLAEMERIAGRQ